MPAYYLFDNVEVLDARKLEDYSTRVAPVVERFGGRYLAIGGPLEVVEGAWRPTYPVLLEFPSAECARQWYHSEDYRELKALRQSSVTANAVLIEGP